MLMDTHEATSLNSKSVFIKIIKRLDEWGRLTLLESFMRRTEIRLSLRSMVHDLKIHASQLQVDHMHHLFRFSILTGGQS